MREKGISTKAVHSGDYIDPETGALTTPIFQTSTFLFPTDDPRTWKGEVPEGSWIYTRYSNPTIRAAEQKLASLEGAEDCLVFSSGMAAISSTLLALLSEGDHFVSMADIYGGTADLYRRLISRMGIEFDLLSIAEMETLEDHVREDTKLVYLESPTNPQLKLVDVEKVTRKARGMGMTTVIDSTFATPCNLRPLELGADVVVHSISKYLGGHSDLIGGAVAGRKDTLSSIMQARKVLGGVMDPQAAFLLQRGMKTLGVRMDRHNSNAMSVARFLEAHPKVASVSYPGLASHPRHELARRDMDGFGGMVCFEVRGSREDTERVLRSLRLIAKAPSLGGVESLASMPANTSHAYLRKEEREALGITDSMIRLSVGIEELEDILDDLDAALLSF